MTTKREYAFDVTLSACVRLKATSEEQARKLLRATLDCLDVSRHTLPTDFVIGEASIVDEPGEETLFEVDGEDV
jgi:hypothetical protein